MMRKLVAGALGLAALGSLTVATPAFAQWHHHHHHYRHHYYHHYYRPYYYPPRVVVRPYPRCWRAWRTVRVYHHWERRLVRVCG
jgi:hypothetical protein